MRTHEQIIAGAGGYQKLAARINADDKALPDRVRFWSRRKSIPADQWLDVVASGVSSLEELAEAAKAKRLETANDTSPRGREAA